LKHKNDYKIIHSKTIPFRFISLYCLATFVAVVASIAFDVGKLWGVFGALHNLMEVAILLLIGQNGKIKGVSFSLVWGAYYLIINTVCLFTNFPIDAVFFKVQGNPLMCVHLVVLASFPFLSLYESLKYRACCGFRLGH